MLRHTWATRLVDAGVQPIHLMAAGGWSSVEMVRRYYTANDEEVLAALRCACLRSRRRFSLQERRSPGVLFEAQHYGDRDAVADALTGQGFVHGRTATGDHRCEIFGSHPTRYQLEAESTRVKSPAA